MIWDVAAVLMVLEDDELNKLIARCRPQSVHSGMAAFA